MSLKATLLSVVLPYYLSLDRLCGSACAILFVTGLLMPAHRSERKRIGRTSQEVSEDDLQECVTYSDGPRAPVFRSSNILGMSGELYLCLCVLLCAQPCTSCNGNCALINPDDRNYWLQKITGQVFKDPTPEVQQLSESSLQLSIVYAS